MFETELFLGFPLSESFQQALTLLPETERALFIQNKPSPYLQQIESDGKLFLGKSLGASLELSALEACNSHILSLLKKLVPSFPYEHHPLLLLALPSLMSQEQS